ncbi:MAG: hypothetical protein WCY15_04925 [Phenylobacterium sp.]|jgi:CBS domain-containing protein|uniref:hypothetical protein n=1 Tax=Phenylobacterium sp. TaxID=1871053 RepID=UPI002A36456E|nr:hypothetical protein [Phenylobacterium sp.]MDX9997991.1 hypothetical protein [Phenylobacterium sp.]
MSATLEFVAPDATVQAAAVLMGELEVGALPVGRMGRAATSSPPSATSATPW